MENRLYKWLKALFIYEFYEEIYPLMCSEGKNLVYLRQDVAMEA